MHWWQKLEWWRHFKLGLAPGNIAASTYSTCCVWCQKSLPTRYAHHNITPHLRAAMNNPTEQEITHLAIPLCDDCFNDDARITVTGAIRFFIASMLGVGCCCSLLLIYRGKIETWIMPLAFAIVSILMFATLFRDNRRLSKLEQNIIHNLQTGELRISPAAHEDSSQYIWSNN